MSRLGSARAALCAVVIGLSAAGCNGDDDTGGGAECTASDCGGDITGTWKVESVCIHLESSSVQSSSGLPPQCTQVIANALRTAIFTPIDAMMEFANGEYVQSGSFRLQATYQFTSACLQAIASANGVSNAVVSTSTCDSMGQQVASNGAQVECAPSAGSCRCTLSEAVALQDSGTYRTSGGQITFDAETQAGSFCVTGNTAVVSGMGSDGGGSYELTRTSKSATIASADAGM